MTDATSAAPCPRAERRRRGTRVALVLLGVGVLASAAGALAWRGAPAPTFAGVKLHRKAGLVELPELNDAGGRLDFYLVLRGEDVAIRTERRKGPIGNGIAWSLHEPVARGAITEIQVWDKDPFRDDLLDRIGIERDDDLAGEVYRIELTRRHRSPLESLGEGLVAAGAVLVLAGLAWLARSNVV